MRRHGRHVWLFCFPAAACKIGVQYPRTDSCQHEQYNSLHHRSEYHITESEQCHVNHGTTQDPRKQIAREIVGLRNIWRETSQGLPPCYIWSDIAIELEENFFWLRLGNEGHNNPHYGRAQSCGQCS